MARKEFLTPVGRIVQGSLYKPQTTDAEGKPLVVKNGPNAGQARVDYYFALAIPKGPEQSWAQTPWGQTIYSAGVEGFPNGAHGRVGFSWKVIDGDSQEVDQRGTKHCDREGFKGCWVVRLSSGYQPKIVTADGSQPITEPDAVKTGYYVQVFAYAEGNGSTQRPGVYVNHMAVALAGYGPEIFTGIDTAAVGFGQGVALPAGASHTPPAGGFNPAAAAAAGGLPGMPAAGGLPGMPAAGGLPGMPAAGGLPGMPAAGGLPGMPAAGGLPGMPAAGGLPGMPAAGGLPGMPAAGGLPGMPAAGGLPGMPGTPTPQVPVMPNPAFTQAVARTPDQRLTAAANGNSYAQLIAGGWTDATLVSQGIMTLN